MQSIKNIFKTTIYLLLYLIIFNTIITILNYFNVLNYKIINILKIIVPSLTFTISGFKIGKISIKNGWLEGIKLSSFVSLILMIISIIFKYFRKEYLIYLLIIICACTFGSILGINKKNTLV
ncbi:MAG: TIGR04086 family membrane protein [Bacilli bacterium]|nr:TIGR04086 family membrane protein [Bacilli bacterium]